MSRPQTSRRARRVLLTVLVIVVVSSVGYVAWTAYRVNRELTAAVGDVAGLERAARSGDEASLDRSLDALSQHADQAADLTSGFAWRLLTWLPVVGDDARGVRTVASVIKGLSGDGLAPLLKSPDRIDALMPTAGRVDVDSIVALQTPVAQAAAVLADASRRLHAEDPSGYVGRLAVRYRALTDRVDDARRGVDAAATALQVMPSMLGRDGPRSYLMVFQNNAEVRATGGIAGSVSRLDVDDGALTIGRQAPGGSLSTDRPVLALTEAEEALYSDPLGTFFLNGTMTPDFPRGAALMRAHWQRAFPDDRVDGVIAVDPVALSYLLVATGPIEVDGVSLTSDTVVAELLHDTYLRLPDPVEQDAFFAAAANAVFAKLVAGDASPQDVLTALAAGAREHRLLVHSFDDTEQQVLDPTVVSGRLVTDPGAAPQIGVFLGDLTGAKMSYYLRTEVSVHARGCADGVQSYAGEAIVSSTAPDDIATQPDYVTGGGLFGTPIGDQTVFVRLHGPVGGTIGTVSLDGEKLSVTRVDQDGRTVVTTVVRLGPGQTNDLRWTMTSGPGQTADTAVSVTPEVLPGNSSSVVRSTC